MQDYAHLSEVCIFGHDCKGVLSRIVPDSLVRRPFQTNLANMRAIGIEVSDPLDKRRGKILVKEKFHFAITLR